MTAEAWGERLTPAFGETARRFPFPIALAALATAIFLVIANEGTGGDTELWFRAFFGIATAAIVALAGNLFAESRPRNRNAALVLTYLVPAVAGILFQIRDTTWFVPWALPAIAILWLSLSATTARTADAEARFWWLNYRAIAAAAIAGLALLIILVGLGAIERTVAALFGFDLGTLVYRNVFPVMALFCAPLYWLATLPRLEDYDPRILTTPDFLARAVGLVGKFVLIPLLLAYAAILLLYCAQIAITRELPQGVLGWMVLGFVIAGAGTWLVLYPPFVADSQIVRFFRRAWFWLTLIPLALFFLAVWVRLDNYGLTSERLILMWAGIWAALVTVIFLVRRGDIRLIPGLAAVILTIATIGPWNIDSLPRWQQGNALDMLLYKTPPSSASGGIPPDWTPEDASRARGALDYLMQSPKGKADAAYILNGHGFEFDARTIDTTTVMRTLGANADIGDATPPPPQTAFTLNRDFTQPVDVAATPYLVAHMTVYPSTNQVAGTATRFEVQGNALIATPTTGSPIRVDLTPLFDGNDGARLKGNVLDFTVGERRYRFVADMLVLTSGDVSWIEGTLFSASPG